MMNPFAIPPVLDVVNGTQWTIGINNFQFNLFFGLSDCKDKKYFILRRYVQNFTEFSTVYRSDHTSCKALFSCAKHHALACNSMVAPKIFGDTGIA